MSKHTDKEILDAIIAYLHDGIDIDQVSNAGWRAACAHVLAIHQDMTREETEVEGLGRRIKALREALIVCGGDHGFLPATEALDKDDAEDERRTPPPS